jgi:excisionase family DNA binding protein
MNAELEPQDIQAIAEKVLELLKPYLVTNTKREQDDTIFDVPGLCEYLKVTPKWVYEQTHLKAIPYYKLSNKALRFKRSEVDKWMERLRTPAIAEPTSKFKVSRRSLTTTVQG